LALKKLGSSPLIFSASESAKSVDISDDGTRIVIGASWHIYGLDNKGQEIWSTTTQSEVWVVNITSDGNLVVAACSDGTIRWYRMNDGELLLSLFMHSDRKRWVVWTPEGYYDAAPGAEYLLGWHVNQGQDRAALFYPISRFRYQYYRPDVIDRVLETLDVAEAVQQADEIAQRFGGSRTRDIAAELPPSITILDPAPGASTSSNQVTINYSIQSPNGEEVTGVKALVNGRPVSETRGLKAKGLRGSLQIDIPSADCVISVLAENRFGSSEPAQVRLKWTGSTMATADLYKPNLYVLAIGVSEYETAELQLDFAAKDAQDFNTTINKQGGSLYSSVETRLLTDANATRANILEGLEWIVKETTQHDIAMIFFAGHGRETTRGTFYYVPVEADLTDRSLRVNGIMREDIKETVATIAGKVIVFIDACHSGSLMETSRRRGAPDMTRIINELTDAENGAVVFSSSSARQFSLEDQGWQNGAFTKALVEGLNGSAARPDGAITWKSLDNYITRRVKELTGGEQAPTTNVPPNTEDYPLAVDPK
ncbi:MAG: caspase family protein, partial [Bacteroidota bacterium]